MNLSKFILKKLSDVTLFKVTPLCNLNLTYKSLLKEILICSQYSYSKAICYQYNINAFHRLWFSNLTHPFFFSLIIKNHLKTNLEKPASKGQSPESRYDDQQGLTRERQHQQKTKSLSSNYWCYNNKILNTVFHPHIFKIKGSAMKFHKSLKNQPKKRWGGGGGTKQW